MENKKQPQYFNGSGTNITSYIESGKTLFFTNENIAKSEAKKIRSYHYTVYDFGKQHIGYAVPK